MECRTWTRNKKYWDQIPEDIDILVTHGPPKGILDMVYSFDGVTPKDRVGCEELNEKVFNLPKLKHHIFGHIHSSHGHQEVVGKHFWNAAICDEQYMAINPITVIDL